MKKNIATALILENNADWDMRIHEIVPKIIHAVNQTSRPPFFNRPSGLVGDSFLPYRNHWDVLWMGHCGTHGKNGRVYQYPDDTVPPPMHEYTSPSISKPSSKLHVHGTRVVFEPWRTSCSVGYAISHQGAVKLRKFFESATGSLDIELSGLCATQSTLTCYSVWPQVMTPVLSTEDVARPLSETVSGDHIRHTTPWTILTGPSLKYSARRNAHVVNQGLGRESWIQDFGDVDES